MGKQKIRYSQSGSRAQRILEAVTPLTGTTAPAVNADYIGQMYVDATGKAAYISVAVGSEVPVNDWEVADASAVLATLTPLIDALEPLTGTTAPAVNADYIGQIYVDTTGKAVYISVGVGSVDPANDWEVADASAVLATLTPLIEALEPLTGIIAPAEHADFVGQMHVDTVTKKVYIAVATDSAAVADDWKEITFVG